MTIYTFGEIKYDSERNTDSSTGFIILSSICSFIFGFYYICMSGILVGHPIIKTEITYLIRLFLILGLWVSIFTVILFGFAVKLSTMLRTIEFKETKSNKNENKLKQMYNENKLKQMYEDTQQLYTKFNYAWIISFILIIMIICIHIIFETNYPIIEKLRDKHINTNFFKILVKHSIYKSRF